MIVAQGVLELGVVVVNARVLQVMKDRHLSRTVKVAESRSRKSAQAFL